METQLHSHTLYHRDQNGQLTGTWTTTLTPYGLKVECRECGKFFGYEPFSDASLPKLAACQDVSQLSYFIERLDRREYAFHPANTPANDEP